MSSKVVLRYLDGKDKITLLNMVLDLAGLEAELESVRKSIGKKPEELKIAIKPNASMFVRRDDDGVTTDPLLVLALVERLYKKGYTNISVVETSNAYDMTYTERSSITVMTAMGLNGGVHSHVTARPVMTAHVSSPEGKLLPYRLVDLGAETVDVKTVDMPDGSMKLSTEWLNTDFRISFAKFKTHVYGGFTLLVKNTYGCLPETNKMYHYHRPTGCAVPAIAQLKICPVHFSIVDGIISADGWMGVKWDRAIPRIPGFILAGKNIAETERAGCRIMGKKPEGSLMTKAAIEMFEEPSDLDGEIRPLENWWNVPDFIASGFPMTEKHYHYYKFQQTVTDGTGTPPFKRKPAGLILTYLLVLPVLIYAFHRRHWVIRKFNDIRLRLSITGDAKAPAHIRADLERLGASELCVLLECLKTDPSVTPVIYGHRIKAGERWYSLPDSTFSRLVRIPEIIEALKTETERSGCAREVEARLKVLNADVN